MFKYGFGSPVFTVTKEFLSAIKSGSFLRLIKGGVEITKRSEAFSRTETFMFDDGKKLDEFPRFNPDYHLSNSVLPLFLKQGDVIHFYFNRDNTSDMIAYDRVTAAVTRLFIWRGKNTYQMPLAAAFMTQEEADSY